MATVDIGGGGVRSRADGRRQDPPDLERDLLSCCSTFMLHSSIGLGPRAIVPCHVRAQARHAAPYPVGTLESSSAWCRR